MDSALNFELANIHNTFLDVLKLTYEESIEFDMLSIGDLISLGK